jgi:predicted metal-dependent phosphoesterase TrpH
MIDLHTHSIFSDGSFTPKQIVQMAESKKLLAIALTDHDTVDGINSFLKINSKCLKVPGVEISINYDKGTFHLLGLFISHKNKELCNALEELKKFRRQRNKKIIQSISDLIGEEITENDISDNNRGELGSPHMANFLVERKVVKDTNEAFERYLGKGRPLNYPKKKFDFEKAVSLIKNAGGKTILAHPDTLRLGIHELSLFIKEKKALGLDGIEVFYNHYSLEDSKYYLKLAEKYNLIISVGSDFHGENKKGVEIASYIYPPENPEEILRNLLK